MRATGLRRSRSVGGGGGGGEARLFSQRTQIDLWPSSWWVCTKRGILLLKKKRKWKKRCVCLGGGGSEKMMGYWCFIDYSNRRCFMWKPKQRGDFVFTPGAFNLNSVVWTGLDDASASWRINNLKHNHETCFKSLRPVFLFLFCFLSLNKHPLKKVQL